MKKALILALVTVLAFVLPRAALADDKQLEKRLEAVEARLERMSALEEENKQLKERLQKTEAKLEKVTAQKVTTVTPVRTVDRQATPVTIATPAIAKETPVTPISTERNWSGVYAGINAGYGANTNNQRTVSYDGLNTNPPFTPPPLYSSINDDVYFSGALAGLQLGYNEVFKNNLMLGIETDANWTNIYDLNRAYNSSYFNYIPNYSNTIGNTTWLANQQVNYGYGYSQTTLQALGTTRFRFGYVLNNFMPYVTGGIAYGLINNKRDLTNAFAMPVPYSSMGYPNYYYDATKNLSTEIGVGWSAGAGFEYMLENNWSAKLEYMYTAIGSLNWERWSSHTYAIDSYDNFGIHQARVGLNYHTDWLKELPVSLR